jgi:hypothetical protein
MEQTASRKYAGRRAAWSMTAVRRIFSRLSARAGLIAIGLSLAVLAETAGAQQAAMPAQNPFLAAEHNNQSHWNDAATDSTEAATPLGHYRMTRRGWRMEPNDALGIPAYSAIVDGREMHWFFSGTALRKLIRTSQGRFIEVSRQSVAQNLAGYRAVSASQRVAQARAVQTYLRRGDEAGLAAYLERQPNRLLSAVEDQVAQGVLYSLFTREHAFIGANARGLVRIDNTDPADPTSPLARPIQVSLPAALFDDEKVRKLTIFATDSVFGLGMTFNGYLVVNTVGGRVVTLDRKSLEVRDVYTVSDAGEVFTNSFAASEVAAGGAVYVASNRRMYRLVVDAAGTIKDDAQSGAWSAAYDSGVRLPVGKIADGTGSTPTLIGFGPGEDRLVVITDGARKMRLVAFWRDEIPTNAQTGAGFASDRIVDQIEVDLGPEIPVVQSEQSVVVYGRNALVINAIPESRQAPPPGRGAYLRGLLAGATRPLPRGVAMFSWDGASRRWAKSWSRLDVNTIATVPMISGASRMAIVSGGFDGRLRDAYHIGLDLDTGKVVMSIATGDDPIFNGAFTGIKSDRDGSLMYTTMFGLVRFDTQRMRRVAAPRD